MDRRNEDLRIYSGIAAIREIVETETLKCLEKLRSSVRPELASRTEHPRLDPHRNEFATEKNGGLNMIHTTGSNAHLRKLARVTGSLAPLEESSAFPDEDQFYKYFDMQAIPPDLCDAAGTVGSPMSHRPAG